VVELLEQGIVTGLLIDGDRHIDNVKEVLKPSDFKGIETRRIFGAIIRIHERREPLDIWNVFTEAGYSKPPSEVLQWLEQTHSSHATTELAKKLRKVRLFEQMAPAIQEVAKSNDPNSRAKVTKLLREMEETETEFSVKTTSDVVKEVIDDFLNADEIKKQIISTGFPTVDELTDGGVRQGNLFVIGARTSVGKSSILWSFCETALEAKKKVLFVSAEMLAKDLFYRYVASSTRTKLKRLRRLDPHVSAKVSVAAGVFEQFPLLIDDSGRLELHTIEGMVERHKPDVLVIDYLQRFKLKGSRSETRAAFFSDVANGLKSIALQKKIVVYAASQLSRDIEKHDRPPTLSDFKESGGLEEAADVALMLWASAEEMMKPTRCVKGAILKNRNGSLGLIDFVFTADETRFGEAL